MSGRTKIFMGIAVCAMAATLRNPWMAGIQLFFGLALISIGIFRQHIDRSRGKSRS
jgi:hypothetical protein